MLILYFSWDGLRGKCLGFWVYLEVKTVGTAVPGTVMSSVQDVQAADVDYDSLTGQDKAEADAARDALQNSMTAIKAEMPAYYSLASSTWGDVATAFNDAVNKLDVLGNTAATFETFLTTDTEILVDSLSAEDKEIGGNVDVTGNLYIGLSSGITAKIPYTITVPFYWTEQVINRLQLDDVFEDATVSVPYNTNDGTKATTALEYAEEQVKAKISELPQVVQDNFTIDVEQTSFSNNLWNGLVKVNNGLWSDSNQQQISVSVEEKNSEEAEEVLNSLKVPTVSVDKSYINVGEVGADFFNNTIAPAIKDADRRISSVVISDDNFGQIVVADAEDNKAWEGIVTITLTNGAAATGKVTVPLKADASAAYKDITLVYDRRADESKNVELGTKVYNELDYNGVSIRLTKKDGTTEQYTNNDGIKAAIDNGAIVVDTSEYEKNSIGSCMVYIRLVNDNTKKVDLPVTVYKTQTVKAEDVNLTQITALKSKDETILKADKAEGNDFKVTVLKAGTVDAELTDDKGNTITVTFVVDNKGNIEVQTDFNGTGTRKSFDAIQADLAIGQDVSMVVQEEDVAEASYETDAKGNDYIRVTPKAVGKTNVEIHFGDAGKFVYVVPVTIGKTGAVTIGNVTGEINVSGVSISAATKKVLADGNYYAEADALNSSTKVKACVSEAIDVDNNKLNIKATLANGKVVEDTLSFSKVDFGFTKGSQFGAKQAFVNVGFGGKWLESSDSEVQITLKEKFECDNNSTDTLWQNYSLGLVATRYTISPSDKDYVSVSLDDGKVTIKAENPEGTASNTTITFYDANGAQATVTVGVKDYKFVDPVITGLDLTKATINWTAPTKDTYRIGEKLDLTGASFSYIPKTNDPTITLNLTEDMFDGFDSSKVTGNQVITFQYGGVTKTFDISVDAATLTVNASDIGADSDEKIKSASFVDGESDIKLDVIRDTYVKVSAEAVDQKAVLTIKTDKGNTYQANLTVDKDGNFTAEKVTVFNKHQVVIDSAELGLAPAGASSEDNAIVTADAKEDSVTLTSIKAGTTTVTVTDTNGNQALIDVTVNADGSISTTVHPYVEPEEEHWVQDGTDWYYYEDGKMVVSDWRYVVEADPYNNNEVGKVWYHFGADGKMQRGWIVDETGWKIYLLDSNGRMMHSQWVNAPAQESLNRPAGLYKLTDDGAVQMNGWAKSVDNENIEWFCNAGNGLFEVDNPASWRTVG